MHTLPQSLPFENWEGWVGDFWMIRDTPFWPLEGRQAFPLTPPDTRGHCAVHTEVWWGGEKTGPLRWWFPGLGGPRDSAVGRQEGFLE